MTNAKKSILHIDDDPDMLEYVRLLLSDIGNVTSIQTANELRQLLKNTFFDIFILDLVLKDGSGSSIAREVKSFYPDTPIVILSSHDITSAIDEASATFIKGRMKEKEFSRAVKKLLAI